MTPPERLLVLLEMMRRSPANEELSRIFCGNTFNAAIQACGADVDRLALIGNGVGWEAVAETDDQTCDIWFMGKLVQPDMPLQAAAEFMVKKYLEAKLVRAMRRARA